MKGQSKYCCTKNGVSAWSSWIHCNIAAGAAIRSLFRTTKGGPGGLQKNSHGIARPILLRALSASAGELSITLSESREFRRVLSVFRAAGGRGYYSMKAALSVSIIVTHADAFQRFCRSPYFIANSRNSETAVVSINMCTIWELWGLQHLFFHGCLKKTNRLAWMFLGYTQFVLAHIKQ